MATVDVVSRYWGCIPPPEREAAHLMSSAVVTPGGFVLAAQINTVFVAFSPAWWERRRDAWAASYNVQSAEIEVDGQTLEVYLANRFWMQDVWACRLGGGCGLADPLCLQLAFFNAP